MKIAIMMRAMDKEAGFRALTQGLVESMLKLAPESSFLLIFQKPKWMAHFAGYPNATCALHHSNPWELLVATILSAQCTDKRVNEVTPGLFRKYPTIRDFASAKSSVAGRLSSSKIVSFVRTRSEIPSSDFGTDGRAPVAMMMCLAW